MKRLLAILSLSQVISWGSTYYAIGVLAPSIGAGLRLDASWIMGAFSMALLISGIAAPAVGRQLDRRGSRPVMATGSVVSAAGMAAIAGAHVLPLLFAGWALVGLAMAMTLYEAAFAAINQAADSGAKQAMSTLTLFGGLASTAFWPFTHALDGQFGWRGALLVLAVLQLLVCLPLHLALPDTHPQQIRAAAPLRPSAEPEMARSRTFWLLASAFALGSFISSAVSAHVINLFERLGYGPADAIWFATLIGPMQVAGRLGDRLFAQRQRAATVGMVALLMLPLAISALMLSSRSAALALTFCILYGASNGVLTIVRGALPRELFGRENYGRHAGALAAPGQVMKALGPVALAFAFAVHASTAQVLSALLATACAAALLFAAALSGSAAPTLPATHQTQ